MKTNLEKWNYYLAIINAKTNEFINSQKEGKTIPVIYYIVYPVGKIAERTIIDVEYSHYKHNGKTYFNGKKPTKKDVEEIAEYSTKEIPFSTDNIYFKYSEIWDKENNRTLTSSVKFNDVVNEIGLYYSLSDAEIISNKVLEFMTSYRNEFGEECSVANIISKERLLEISNNINCAVAKLSKDDGNCNKPAVSSLLIAWEQFKKANWWESDAIDVEKVLMERFTAIYNC